MLHALRHARLLAALSLTLLIALLAGSLPASPAAAATTTTVPIIAAEDARTQGGSPDTNFGAGFLFVSTLNGHISFVRFDLLDLPANAVIDAARLELDAPTLNDGPNNVELGRIDAAWDQDTLTWATQPAITWGGPVTSVSGPTLATWNVTQIVQAWHSGAVPNFGLALRGDGGEPLSFSSLEAGQIPPTLVVRYTIPDQEGARPDQGDAPDSSNSLGVNPNTAYPGVPGSFPTVWGGTPAGQPAGPRHNNAQIQAVLGEHLSREAEADSGADEDGPNNILAGGADNADNDRGDDGWRNRNVPFRPCQSTALTVRVRKAAGAELNRMFLNVWFDGTRDGDWDDQALCTPPEEALNVPATEWIVQDYFVDLTGIPAGGFVEINLPTEVVLNTTPLQRHWMRFTLSETRAVQFAPGRADGRGPHPGDARPAFAFGETEDVLQRPQPPGEDGTLALQKRVIAPNQPVPYGGTVTYQIALRHNGGTQPVQARIRDALPWPQHLLPGPNGLIEVTSPTGGAAPLQAQVDVEPPQGGQPPQFVVKWQGTLAPDSEVRVSFLVHVHPLCAPNQQTVTIRNLAEAKPVGGALISAEESFTAACPGFDGGDLELDWEAVPNAIDLNDFIEVPLSGMIANPLPVSVTLGVRLQRAAGNLAAEAVTLPGLDTITLGPGERRKLDFSLKLAPDGDELQSPPDISEVVRLQLCLIPGEGDSCPDRAQHPNYWSETRPLTITVRPNDLGDAPDSSNHAGAPMTAYPTVQGNFPTVFDPATGLPEGPRHAHPRPFHLGERVSREAEADVGPDQDPANNIEPAANQANLDRADDGSRLTNLAHCQPANAEVLVAVSQQAWSWFKSREQPAYLNVWLDSNRDGDWADGTTCQGPQGQQQDVVEHILIDAPIDVAALGPGLHPLSITTSRVAWPAQLAERPSWVRFTLSERPANKTLSLGAISYGDGRGYDKPFQTGETEDHLINREGGEGGGPDLALRLRGGVRGGAQGATQVAFNLGYANEGSQPATGAVLTFTKPEQLRDLEIVLLQAPGIPAANITQSRETISFALPDMPAGSSSAITLGWNIPTPSGQAGQSEGAAAAAQVAYSASAAVTIGGDVDPSDNQASVTVSRGSRAPIVAALAGDGTLWGRADTTCRDGVALVGRGEPNSIIAILIGLTKAGEATTDAAGNFSFSLTALPEGRQRIHAVYNINSPRDQSSGLALDVDTSLPVDPLSLTLTDGQGRVIHPPTLGWGSGTAPASALLRAGQSYEVSIDSCDDDPNQRITIALGDTTVQLRDDDGDGRYTGTIGFGAGASLAASGELRITATSGASSVSLVAPLGALTPGVVKDSAGAPVQGAAVKVLETVAVEGGEKSYEAWPAAALGQPNPQTTGVDGAYSFVAPDATSSLEVASTGFQTYRSWAGAGGAIVLTRLPAGAASHTVLITEEGFVPAVLRVGPGSVIEWVNADLVAHSATGAAWDSGALLPGERYLTTVGATGSFAYGDGADPLSRGTIVVDPGAPGGFKLHLPLLRR